MSGATQGDLRTLIQSAKDLKPLSTIEGFFAQAMNHDGLGEEGRVVRCPVP